MLIWPPQPRTAEYWNTFLVFQNGKLHASDSKLTNRYTQTSPSSATPQLLIPIACVAFIASRNRSSGLLSTWTLHGHRCHLSREGVVAPSEHTNTCIKRKRSPHLSIYFCSLSYMWSRMPQFHHACSADLRATWHIARLTSAKGRMFKPKHESSYKRYAVRLLVSSRFNWERRYAQIS